MNTSSTTVPPRIVITGIGAISPLGHTAEANWDALIAGRSGIGPITQFDTLDIPVKIAGEVKDFDPRQYMDFKEARRMSRASLFAVAAARMALEDSGLPMPLPDSEQCGTFIGSGAGGLEVVDRELHALRSRGFRNLSPFALMAFLPNMPIYHVSILSGAKGPYGTLTSACASGTQAIGAAMDAIRLGRAHTVVAGGIAGLVHETTVASFARAGALSTRNDDPARACRPFDANRDGTVISEGAGMLVLERLDMAEKRNAKIYAEVLGHASSTDAYHIAQPDPNATGVQNAMRWALQDANVSTIEIDYINAHGTATKLNDSSETLAIKKLFGEYAYNLPVSSSKSVLGHALGAAGAIEAIFCVYALQNGIIPPTWNYETRDPECDLDYIPNEPRPANLRTVMSNSFGMGGQNACLVLRRYEPDSSS